jgi:hypothetical protein
MLVSTLLLSLTLFSQTGTNNKQQPTVCIPESIAQKIAVDLLRLDSVSVELTTTQQVLRKTETKVAKQDSVIQTYLEKIQTYQKESAAQTERYETCAGRVTKLEKDVTTLTEKNRKLKNLAKGLGGGLVASLGTLVLLIALK